MKIIFIGDIHGRSLWKIPAYTEEYDIIVFVGDYFDTRDNISTIEQIYNFKEICSFKRKSKKQVVMLLGNHDMYIEPRIDQSVVSGYQKGGAIAITSILQDNRDLLQMAYNYDKILVTHAGVTKTWLLENGWDKIQNVSDFINDIWKFTPTCFDFMGLDPYGDDICQTPIWVRPRSLMRDSKNLGYIQVMGHTTMNQIDIEGKATGGNYWFIDTLGTSGEYLIWEDGVFSTKRG